MAKRKETIQTSEVVEKEEEFDVYICDYCDEESIEDDFLNVMSLNPSISMGKTKESHKVSNLGPHGMHIEEKKLMVLRKSDLVKVVRGEQIVSNPISDFEKISADPTPADYETHDAILVEINPKTSMRHERKLEVCDICAEALFDA